MFKKALLLCMLLSILPRGTHAGSLQESAPNPLRLMVEGEPSLSRSIIEAMRRNVARYDFKLEFVGGLDNQHDVRLIVSAGNGNVPCPEMSSSNAWFHYNGVVALAPDGKLLFTLTRSGRSAIEIVDDTAIGVIRNLYSHATSPRKQTTFDSGVSQEPPAEPGIYYKNGTEWLRLMETLARPEVRGTERFMLTFGFSEVRSFLVYSGASANLQVPEQKPEFYVRGFLVSEQDVQIIRLEKRKDHRQAQISSFSRIYWKTGYKENDLHRVMVTRVSNSVYKIAPASELPQGEYVLQLYASDVDSRGYEFGITSMKK